MTLLRMPDDSFYGLGVLFQRPQLKTCWLISCRQWQPTNVADDHDDDDDDDGQWRAWKGFLCCHLSKVWKIDWILLSSVYLMQKWVSPIGIKHRLFTLSVLIIFIIFILKTWSTVVYTFDPFCERSCWRHLIRRRIALDVHYLRVVVVCCAFVLPAKLSLWCMYKRTYIHVYIRTYYAYSPCPDPPPPSNVIRTPWLYPLISTSTWTSADNNQCAMTFLFLGFFVRSVRWESQVEVGFFRNWFRFAFSFWALIVCVTVCVADSLTF